MNFFKALRNFIRCVFCPRINCHSRFLVGSRHYYSGSGFVRTTCPKKHYKYENLTAKELTNRILEDKEKEEND